MNIKDYTDEEIGAMIAEIESRPYQEYDDEALDEAFEDVLSEKELRRLLGIGPINKIKKFFSDWREARTIKKLDKIYSSISARDSLETIAKMYIDDEVNEDESK